MTRALFVDMCGISRDRRLLELVFARQDSDAHFSLAFVC